MVFTVKGTVSRYLVPLIYVKRRAVSSYLVSVPRGKILNSSTLPSSGQNGRDGNPRAFMTTPAEDWRRKVKGKKLKS